MPAPFSRLVRSYERAFKRNPSLTLAIANGCLKCFGDFMAQLLPTLASHQPFVLDIKRSLRFLLFGILHGPCVGKWHEFLEHRVPLTVTPRESSSMMITTPTEAEQELQLIETEKSLTTHRPISIRSRSSQGDPHGSTIRGFTGSSNPLAPLAIDYSDYPKRNRAVRFWGLTKRLLLDQLLMAPLYTFLFIFITGWFEGLSVHEIKERLGQLYWYILTANWKIWPLIQVINFNFMPLQFRVPWQGSCGVLWTVFLSLSTHSAHYGNSTINNHLHESGHSLISIFGSAIFRIFKSDDSSTTTAPSELANNQNLTGYPTPTPSQFNSTSISGETKKKRVIG